MLKSTTKIIGTLAILISSVLLLAFTLSNTEDNKDFEIVKNMTIFMDIYRDINTHYVDEVKPEKLINTGLTAMLKSLDPYSVYIPEEQVANFRFQITGKYGGIGAIVRNFDDKITIVEPYEGFPAYNAGLQAGDVITAIDGQPMKLGKNFNISNSIKGAPGTKLSLTVKRPGTSGTIPISLIREEVSVPNVPHSTVIGDNTGYILLTSFTEDAGKHVANALKDLKKQHDIKSLILDLRGNGGGLLTEAVNLTNVFVEKGEMVVQTKGKIKEWDRAFKTLNAPIDSKIPMVVLIDGNSASASEIVCGALQDLDRAVVMGRPSFGKGLVQNTLNVGFNAKLKLTTAKYYIPSGRCIQSVDYKEGEAVKIDETLKSRYKTKGGRPVLDGGGIQPDVLLKRESPGKIVSALLNKNLIFHYATNYKLNHKEIAQPETFSFNDEDFADFITFLSDKEYPYSTESEKILDDLVKEAKEEQYYDQVKSDVNEMKARFNKDKANDINKYKDDVVYFLEREVVTRYYNQKGKYTSFVQKDKDIKEAIKILNNSEQYDAILEGKSGRLKK